MRGKPRFLAIATMFVLGCCLGTCVPVWTVHHYMYECDSEITYVRTESGAEVEGWKPNEPTWDPDGKLFRLPGVMIETYFSLTAPGSQPEHLKYRLQCYLQSGAEVTIDWEHILVRDLDRQTKTPGAPAAIQGARAFNSHLQKSKPDLGFYDFTLSKPEPQALFVELPIRDTDGTAYRAGISMIPTGDSRGIIM